MEEIMNRKRPNAKRNFVIGLVFPAQKLRAKRGLNRRKTGEQSVEIRAAFHLNKEGFGVDN
jgi:hypothetical protein